MKNISKSILVDGKDYNIASPPLYFVRSGYINTQTSNLRYLGIVNYLWSSTSEPQKENAFFLSFGDVETAVSTTGHQRFYAFPIRLCADY